MGALHLLKSSNGMDRMLIFVFASLFLVSLGIISHNAFADTVVATIPVKIDPFHIGVNTNNDMVYVLNQGFSKTTPQSISVIDGATDNVVQTIPISTSILGIGVNQITNRIYVAAPPDIDVIDGANNSIIDSVQVGGASGVGVNPNTNMIYVGNDVNDTVSVINGSTNNIVASIPVGSSDADNPQEISVNPETDMIYVTQGCCGGGNTVSVIDGKTDSVLSKITVGTAPFGVAVNPNTNMIYVANDGNSTVSVINGSNNSVVNTIPIAGGAFGVGINPDTNMIYVTNDAKNTVSRIDGSTNKVVETIQVGNGAAGVGVNPDTNKIYISNRYDSTVTVIQGITPPPPTTSQLQVNSDDSYANAITGFYTELYAQNGTQLDAGYTPYNFTLDTGQNYTVHVENYGNYKFNHWLDTNSTDANRTISITSDKFITAVYATIPTRPSNLTATAVSSSEIDLSWNAPSSDGGSPITGYRIQISTDDSTWTTMVKNTGNTNTAYSDTGLSPDTTYYYRVFALNSVGSSYRSNVASATTPLLTVPGTGITQGNVQSTSGTTSPSGQITLSSFNAGAGSNQLLLVGVSANNNNVTSVTFGGVPLTRAAYSFYNNDAEFWYLSSPAGSGDIVVTFSGATQAVVGAYSFSGVDQASPIANTAKAHNLSASSPAISITTKYPNDWVLDLPSIYGGSTLGSPTCTQEWDDNVPNAITGASSSAVVPLPSTVSCGWTASSADLWDDVAVELKAN